MPMTTKTRKTGISIMFHSLLLLLLVSFSTTTVSVSAFVLDGIPKSHGNANAHHRQYGGKGCNNWKNKIVEFHSVGVGRRQKQQLARRRPIRRRSGTTTPATSTTTSLNALIEVPDHFFAFTFPMLGVLLSVSKGFARRRLEERAFEQRLEEARERRLSEDPSVSELELRRQEAAVEWSAYGKPRMDEEKRQRRQVEKRKQREKEKEARTRTSTAFGEEDVYEEEMDGRQIRGQRRGRRVRVMERDEEEDEEEELSPNERRSFYMTDDEINRFEVEYNVEYDPYYDDPYTEDELPNDMKFQVDRKYGDRTYENGEIFYKDKASGLYYRQGAKPRSDISFW